MRSRILEFLAIVVVVGLALGCNTSSKDHSGRSSTKTGAALVATSSVTTVQPAGQANLSIVTGSNGTPVSWSQVNVQNGDPVASFLTGTTGTTVSVRAPASGPAGPMYFQATATGHPSSNVICVFVFGTAQHTVSLKYVNSPAGTPDRVEATLVRQNGANVTKNSVSVTYTMVTTAGETVVAKGTLLIGNPQTSLTASTSLGTTAGGVPIDFTMLNGIVDATFYENFGGGNVSMQSMFTTSSANPTGASSSSPYP